MPVLTDSGKLIPTDEYKAIWLSELPTLPYPALSLKSPLPPKKPSGVWRPSQDAVEASVQYAKYADQRRTFFGVFDWKYSVATASREEWLMFLGQVGYNTTGYNEGTVAPGLIRRDIVNSLLDAGKLRLLQTGTEGSATAQFFLVASVSCQDLARERLWNTEACCPRCHSHEGTLIKHILKDRREVMLCCRADKFIGDYPMLPKPLPLCDWEQDVDPPPEWSPSLLD